jgi:molybdate transport system regulatory protein
MGPAAPPMSQIDRSGRPVEAHRRKEEADDDDRPWTQSIGEAPAYWLCNHCRRELVAQDNRDLSDRLWSGQSRSARMIAETGLIAAAGRAVRVSYKRAWQLLDAMNRCSASRSPSRTRTGARAVARTSRLPALRSSRATGRWRSVPAEACADDLSALVRIVPSRFRRSDFPCSCLPGVLLSI